MTGGLRHVALRTSLIYALVAALWIVLSDRVLLYLAPNRTVQSMWASAKGLVFVAVTASLLYWALRRQLAHWEWAAVARRQAQQALHLSELLAGKSRDAMLLLRREDGRILEANAAAVSSYGYSREELLRRTVHDLRAAEAGALTRGQMAEADVHGILFETVHRRQDGSTFPVEVSSQGATVGDQRVLISVIRDVTERNRTAATAQLTEERYRSLFKNMLNGFAYCRMLFAGDRPQDFIYLAVNDAFESLTGLKNVAGRKVSEVIPGIREDDPELFEIYGRVARTGTPERFETYVKALKMWFEIAVYSPGRDHFVAVFDVITARKEADARLREKQAQLSEALQISRLAYWEYDVLEDRFHFNDQFYSLLRTTARREGGYDLTSAEYTRRFVHPDDAAVVGTEIQKARAAADPNYSRELDHRVIFADGEVGHFAVYIRIQKDVQGRTVRTHGANMDITERKRAEARLRESEERFRQLAENIAGVFWMVEPDYSRVLYVSPAYEAIWGRSCESLYRDPGAWAEAIVPEDRERVRTAVAAKQAAGQYDEEYRIVRPDGEVRWIHDRAFPIKDDAGAVLRLVGVAEDVTERKTVEAQHRQAQKIEELGQLAAGIAHDFNNLLTVIQMQVSLLEKTGGLAPEVRTSVQEISDSAKRAATLTGQLLTFSRQHVMELQHLDLSQVVADMSRMLARILGEDIRVGVEYATVPLAIHGDRGMIEQLLLNLAVNARDAMPQGGKLVIQTALAVFDAAAAKDIPHARPGEFACISVIDTGTGIPPQVLPRIFEPFFTTKDVSRGTGLGLATVYGIIQQHKGWITVESEVNRGSTFRVYLPRSTAAVSGPTPPDRAMAEARGGGETILVVEDEAPVRMLVQNVLERFGYRVLEATTGAAALEVWKANHQNIQLLLTDYLMPDGMTGLELAQILSRENPGLRVILTSGYGPEIAHKSPALDASIVFLPKPFAVGSLISAVRSCLDREARRS